MSKKLRAVERMAWCLGFACLAVLLAFRVEAGRTAKAAQRLGHVSPPMQDGSQADTQSAADKSPDLSSFKGVIGRLEMPALGLSVPILNDYDPNSLRQGVGRIRGTAVPGGLGNFVVAGHRDTYFRPLRRVAHGMKMHVVTSTGSYDYLVDATSIVLPQDVDVLDIGDRPEMTLITCYPFDYIGAAPKRFIVRGHLVSAAAD